ncbi:membrane-bound lytic murein transglycosylase D [Aquimonas voraii]|uniref:Membrane-bound lytic murein transglycosylase D n=2 Tax=Aquimonas voraii TaxID=265719 RepID=A0A1G6SCM8_9GAMM|nr:membrane-bound lytic murein transglycosylase D [Aquimonas voraii]
MFARLTGCALALLLAACSAAPTRSAADAVEDASALGASFDAALDDALGHVERVRANEAVEHATLVEARDRLRDAARACLEAAGCGVERVLAGYERLAALGLAVGEDFEAGRETAEPESGGDSPLLADLPEAQRSITLLNGRELRDLIELNTPVKSAMVEWLTWMRPQLITAWENYHYMRHLMWPEFEQAGLPEALLFGILAKESGGRVHAVSHAGASGPLQFMYQTGLGYGLGRVDGFDTRFDAQLASRASVRYLNDRFRELNGSLELALAAYNGGEGRIRRIHQATGGKSFWHPQVFSQLPRETQDYVPMVLAAAWLFLHPEEVGLEFPTVDLQPSGFTLAQPSTLNELTLCLGQQGIRDGWFRTLRNLNPRFEPHAVIPAGTVIRGPQSMVKAYAAHCVSGPRLELARALAAANRPSQPATASAAGARSYTVRRGDSLHSIARRHQCAVEQLARANGVRGPRYLIKPGQRLQLVGCRRP